MPCTRMTFCPAAALPHVTPFADPLWALRYPRFPGPKIQHLELLPGWAGHSSSLFARIIIPPKGFHWGYLLSHFAVGEKGFIQHMCMGILISTRRCRRALALKASRPLRKIRFWSLACTAASCLRRSADNLLIF